MATDWVWRGNPPPFVYWAVLLAALTGRTLIVSWERREDEERMASGHPMEACFGPAHYIVRFD